MTDRLTPDICVIGAGSGGLTVAAAAAAFGVEVVLIERGRMGGDCLNHGCVPSKAMIAAAHHAHAIAEAPAFGIDVAGTTVDFERVQAHVRAVIASIAPNDSAERFEAMGVRVIRDAARFADSRTVVAGGYEIGARRFVVATGSRPAVPPIQGLDSVPYLTNETLFDSTVRPDHLIVIGGGPIGLEMAQAHRRLGSAVTVIEAASPLARDDPELAALVVDRLKTEGIAILDGARVREVAAPGTGGIAVTCEHDGASRTIEGSHLLVATGRTPDVDDLCLDAAGIDHDKRGIAVGANLRTSNKRVYAIGDVTGKLQFTHTAGYHAGLVVQQILFRVPARENPAIIPWTTFTDPELAHVGLSEADARKRRRSVNILRWPLSENDRGRTERRTDGLIKLVTDRKGRILGASIAGPHAGEMIHLWALAIARKLSVGDIRSYVGPYPTLSEIGKRAALSYYSPVTRKPLVRGIVRLLRRFG